LDLAYQGTRSYTLLNSYPPLLSGETPLPL
jgi:hypothetical protein